MNNTSQDNFSARDRFAALAAGTRELENGRFKLRKEADYERLLEHIRVHKYLKNQDLDHVMSDQEAFVSWYEEVYTPLSESLEDFQFETIFRNLTPMELFLRASDHRFYLQVESGRYISADSAVISYGARFAPSRLSRTLYRLGLSA